MMQDLNAADRALGVIAPVVEELQNKGGSGEALFRALRAAQESEVSVSDALFEVAFSRAMGMAAADKKWDVMAKMMSTTLDAGQEAGAFTLHSIARDSPQKAESVKERVIMKQFMEQFRIADTSQPDSATDTVVAFAASFRVLTSGLQGDFGDPYVDTSHTVTARIGTTRTPNQHQISIQFSNFRVECDLWFMVGNVIRCGTCCQHQATT